MPAFKDFLKKAKEVAEKGIEMVSEAMEFERLLKDFDEVVASTIAEILQEHGYRGLGQEESDSVYVLKMAIDDMDRVKPLVERDMLRRYSPRDREKIVQVIPDIVEFRVSYTRRGQQVAVLMSPSHVEDVSVEAILRYYVEKKGFLGRVSRDDHEVRLGRFSFKSSDYVNYETKEINREKLREYLESKLKAFGLI